MKPNRAPTGARSTNVQNNTNTNPANANPFAGLIASGLGTPLSFACMLIRSGRTDQATEIFGPDVVAQANAQIKAESKPRTAAPKPVAHRQMEAILHAGSLAMDAAYRKLTEGAACTTTKDGVWPETLGSWLATIPNRNGTATKTMHTTGIHEAVGTCKGSSVDLVIRGNFWRHQTTKAQALIKAGQEALANGQQAQALELGKEARQHAQQGQSSRQQQAAQALISAAQEARQG